MNFEFIPNKGILIKDKQIVLPLGMTEYDESILLKGEEYLWEKSYRNRKKQCVSKFGLSKFKIY